ncbi:MAG: hypothetical protein MJA27_19505 [Pseudanabaenales cyanobacterium]|nr:hypothetical protein [Pseudanabaenales cyanobacterium]
MSQLDANSGQTISEGENYQETGDQQEGTEKRPVENKNYKDQLEQIKTNLSNIFTLEESKITLEESKISKNLNPSFIQKINDGIEEIIRHFEERGGRGSEKFLKYLAISQKKILLSLYSLTQARKLTSSPLETSQNEQDVKAELVYIQGCIDAIYECRSNVNQAIRLYPDQDHQSPTIHKGDAASSEHQAEQGNLVKDVGPIPISEDAMNTTQESSPLSSSSTKLKPNQNHRSVIINVYKTQEYFNTAIEDFNDFLGDEEIVGIPAIPSKDIPLEHPLVQRVLKYIYDKGKFPDFAEWFTSNNSGRNDEFFKQIEVKSKRS